MMENKILILLTTMLLTSNFCFGNVDSFKSFWLKYDSLTVFKECENENLSHVPLVLDQRKFDFTHPLINYVETDSMIYGVILGNYEFEPSLFIWMDKDLFWFKLVSGGKYNTYEAFLNSIDRLYYLNRKDCIAIEIYFNAFVSGNMYCDARIYDAMQGIIYKKEVKFLKETYFVINGKEIELDNLRGLITGIQDFRNDVPNKHVNYNPKYISFRLLNVCNR